MIKKKETNQLYEVCNQSVTQRQIINFTSFYALNKLNEKIEGI